MVKFYSIISLILLNFHIIFSQIHDAPPNPKPDLRFKTDILLIVAHPDDETAIASYLARAIFDEQKRVTVIYGNRGNGGGNSNGNEQATAMSAVREIEARKACALLGIQNVWFLDGVDTPGQDVFHSLQRWQHGKILEQVIRLIRLTRPEVIITWMPHYVAGENHGDHQAAAVITVEAFDLAGNPTVFPAQVTPARERTDINNFTEGLLPWQPKKLYFFSDVAHPIKADGPLYEMTAISPSKKVPYYRLAAELHTCHLTQGDVSDIAIQALSTGDFESFIQWLSPYRLIFGKSVVPCHPDGEVFEGIDTKICDFHQVRGFKPQQRQGVTLELGGVFAFYREFWQAHEIEHIGPLVEPEIMINNGGYLHIPLLIRNDTSDSICVELTSKFPDGWSEVAGTARYRLAPTEVYPVQTFFFAPNELRKEAQEIIWSAALNTKIIGSVNMKVYLNDWTLPQ